MSFFYSREAGPEGHVITGEGSAQGVNLSILLEAGALPVRAALELVAYLADIISLADEDRAVHGDIGTNDVRVDNDGTVALEGYGVTRRAGRAPEGRPSGVATDVYGLGATLLAALTGQALGAVPRDRDGHDEAIVQRLITVDWKHIAGKRWLEDLQRFLCAMFAFAPEERPAPLDVANVLTHVAGQSGGDDLAVWASRAVRAAGGTVGRVSQGTITPDEDLGGPQALSGPMTATTALRIRQASSAKGESTAFWSRDRINAMLAEEDEEEMARPVRQQWSPDAGKRAAPPLEPIRMQQPKANPPPGLTSLPPTPMQPIRPLPPAQPPQNPIQPMDLPPVAQAPLRPPVAQSSNMQPPIAQTSTPRSPVAQPSIGSGIAQSSSYQPQTPSNYDYPDEDAGANDKRSMLKWVVIGVGLLAVLCLGGGGLGAWLYLKDKDATDVGATTAPVEKPVETVEKPVEKPPEATGGPVTADTGAAKTATPEPTPAPTPAPTPTPPPDPPKTTTKSTTTSAPKTTSTSTKSSTKSTSSSTKSSTPKTTSSSATTSTRTASPSNVKFVVNGEATVQCGDGQQSSFAGSTRLTFTDVTACRVKIGPAMGAVQVTKTATFTCNAGADGRVTCIEG